MGPIKFSLYLLYIKYCFNNQKVCFVENLKEKIQTAVNIYKTGNLTKAKEITEQLISANPKVAFLYNLSLLLEILRFS